MKIILYTLSVVMVIVWAISFFVYAIGSIIHFVLIFAAIAGLIGMMRKS